MTYTDECTRDSRLFDFNLIAQLKRKVLGKVARHAPAFQQLSPMNASKFQSEFSFCERPGADLSEQEFVPIPPDLSPNVQSCLQRELEDWSGLYVLGISQA